MNPAYETAMDLKKLLYEKKWQMTGQMHSTVYTPFM